MHSPLILRQTRRLLRRIGDVVPPTWRGAILAAVSGLCLWLYAFGHLDLVLYVVGITGIALLAVASLVVGAAALWLRRRVPAAPDGARLETPAGVRRVEAEVPVRTGWAVPALTWLPLVKVRWEWLAPADVEVRARPVDKVLREEVVARRRGHAPQVRRRLTVEDVFGLTRVSWVDVQPSPVTVLPFRGQLKHMPVIQSMTGAEGLPYPTGAPEGDRMEIRRYTPGDSVRHILWKTYARTRQLNVRLPERTIERTRKTIAYLLAGPDDEAAAAAARVALEAGALGDEWTFGADGTDGSTEDLETALEAIARSGSFTAGDPSANGNRRSGSGLGAFLREVGNQGEAHCIVFAPSCTGPWTADVLEAVRDYPGALSFVLGTDGVRRDTARPLWHRLLFAAEAPRGTRLEELGTLLRRLGTAGCPSLVVDRVTGRAFNQAQQQALGALA